jgi:hypothetical protein
VAVDSKWKVERFIAHATCKPLGSWNIFAKAAQSSKQFQLFDFHPWQSSLTQMFTIRHNVKSEKNAGMREVFESTKHCVPNFPAAPGCWSK